jgi:hypothetical protein
MCFVDAEATTVLRVGKSENVLDLLILSRSSKTGTSNRFQIADPCPKRAIFPTQQWGARSGTHALRHGRDSRLGWARAFARLCPTNHFCLRGWSGICAPAGVAVARFGQEPVRSGETGRRCYCRSLAMVLKSGSQKLRERQSRIQKANGARRSMWGEDGNGVRLI